MTTLLLQNLSTLLLLGFGALAIVIAGGLDQQPVLYRASWHITGVVFALYSVDKLIQGVWGTAAFAVGPGVPLYDEYLRFAPAFNHSRTFLLFALYALLAAIAVKRTPVRRSLVWIVALAALTFGGTVGVLEGTLEAARHFSRTALLDTLGFVALGSILLLALVRDTADRLLWMALACQGFRSIIGVLFLAAMAWLDVPGSWTPPNWMIESVRVAFTFIMVLLAFARYRAMRRGTPVRGLLPNNDLLGRPTLA